MRVFTGITLGAVTAALALAACDGSRSSMGPEESPSLSKINPQTQYIATLTCNAPASNSFAHVTFNGALDTFLFCAGSSRVTVTSFTNFVWSIELHDSGFVKACPHKGDFTSSVSHTGKFSCKDIQTGLSAVLTIAPA